MRLRYEKSIPIFIGRESTGVFSRVIVTPILAPGMNGTGRPDF